jgi:transposase
VNETPADLIVTVETAATVAGCATCGVQAEAHDRLRVDVRDLPCFGRPARLAWMKRRWQCAEAACPAKTWAELASGAVPTRAVLTVRAGIEATRLVGELAQPVASVARELGVCWWTVMEAVKGHGAPLVEDPERVGPVRAMGIDETNYQSAKPDTRRCVPPPWSTSIVALSST